MKQRYGRSTYFVKNHFKNCIQFNFHLLPNYVSAFRQDICETSTLNNWTEHSVSSSSAQPVELTSVENQSNNQR